MPEEIFLKCSCRNCAGHIEFPADQLGQTIPCPHCEWETELIDASASSRRALHKKGSFLFAVLVSLLLAAALAYGILARRKTSAPSSPRGAPVVEVLSKPGSPELLQKIQRLKKEDQDDRWKEWRPGTATLEKTGTRLVYAVGTILNDSDRQRFGVTVELDLFDTQGAKLGTSSDYTQVIEPKAEWKFKALVTDASAVRAEISAIKEN